MPGAARRAPQGRECNAWQGGPSDDARSAVRENSQVCRADRSLLLAGLSKFRESLGKSVSTRAVLL